MHRVKLLTAAGAALILAFAAALACRSVFHIDVRARHLEASAALPDISERGRALELRLVDSGGVGIPLAGDWGTDYSHDLRAFREVILERRPYVDPAAFEGVERDWRAYVDRMLDYGNNAIAIPLFLELIGFDRQNGFARAGQGSFVYGDASPFVDRHAAVRRAFGPLFDWTDRRGMKVFLSTDMLALTPPLQRHLQRVAGDMSPVGVNTANPAVWEVYREGLEELFDEMPSISGLVIRIGEAGSLYHSDDWPYRSEMGVRNANGLRAMLQGLLPVFEAHHKTLVLRTWTVGAGALGRLHVDPQVYDSVLGGIDSPALVVSTKYTSGDFFSYLSLNRTLAVGRHRRLIELQARPEFEGFGAFPDFLGEDHARALRQLARSNPHIIGTYIWSQMGGPLRAGPRSLYPLHGFWLWTDANMYVTSRLALDPSADVRTLARQWAAKTFGDDGRVVESVTNVLMRSRSLILNGLYIRPFAEREVRLRNFELPPLMWIFEWDMVGGWHSLLSVVFLGTRDAVDAAIADGDAAAAAVRRSRDELKAAFAVASHDSCSRWCDGVLRSLDYQATLFDTLAAWRRTFLNYYRWLDTGDSGAWTQWRASRVQFRAAAARHVARFGQDFDFPALDLTSAEQALTIAERGVWVRRAAGGLLFCLILILAAGSPLGRRWNTSSKPGALTGLARIVWTSTTTPWRLTEQSTDLRSSIAGLTAVVMLVGFVVGALTGFASARITAGALTLVGVIGIAFNSTATDLDRVRRDRPLVTALGCLLPGLMVTLGALAYYDAMGIWYRFWTSPTFGVVSLAIVLCLPLWTEAAMLMASTSGDWHLRVGPSVAAIGAGLLTMAVLLPDWVHVLRYLDRPLNVAPATETMLFALRTYLGVSLSVGLLPWLVGLCLLAGGYAITRRRPRPAASRSL
jgi:Glycosyl hydrolase family 67 C-terminus